MRKLTAVHLLQYTAMRVTTLHNQYHSPWEHTYTRTELPKRMLSFSIRFLVIFLKLHEIASARNSQNLIGEKSPSDDYCGQALLGTSEPLNFDLVTSRGRQKWAG